MIFQLTKLDNGSYIHPDDPGEPGYNGPTPRVSVTDEEKGIIADQCAGVAVVEFGTGLGVSTCALFVLSPLVYTIDPDPWVWENVWPGLPETIQRAPSSVGLPTGTFGAAFIDGLHTRPSVDHDIAEAMRLVESGGLIILHDWTHNDVKSAVADAGLTVFAEHTTTHGIGVARRP